ncbi:MAG: hypothetical protein U0992_10740 [Planctomycetaceae bacterium]
MVRVKQSSPESEPANRYPVSTGAPSDQDQATHGIGAKPPDLEGNLTRVEANGEQHLIEGDAVRALREFDRILAQKDRAQDDVLHYRCGICAGYWGPGRAAKRSIGRAAAVAHDESLITLCKLGRAFIWRKLGHADMSLQLWRRHV